MQIVSNGENLKCQGLISAKSKENIINLLSAELVQRVAKVNPDQKCTLYVFCIITLHKMHFLLQNAYPAGDQVMGKILTGSGNILSWRLLMKYFLWSFSPYCWFKKGSCQFLAKEYVRKYWLTT